MGAYGWETIVLPPVCLQEATMSAIPILKYSALESATLDAAAAAYEEARDGLRLSDHIDPLTTTLAQKVVAAAQTG